MGIISGAFASPERSVAEKSMQGIFDPNPAHALCSLFSSQACIPHRQFYNAPFLSILIRSPKQE
ncbi:MAG: hypothetical protein EHM45_15670 [Desulfobacteraceae bacterium]|nr:MAG: hypothetical protein EHM45_15670 [Desulfobacteraceae bacterium]